MEYLDCNGERERVGEEMEGEGTVGESRGEGRRDSKHWAKHPEKQVNRN